MDQQESAEQQADVVSSAAAQLSVVPPEARPPDPTASASQAMQIFEYVNWKAR
jgi:hypothetical protein